MTQNLQAYVQSLEWKEGEPSPVVGLDLFFEGNDEEESIAPNQWGDGRPPLAELYARFKEIEARPEVSAVFVGLHFDWNNPDDADSIPPAETVFIVTSASRSQVEGWLTGLHADGALKGWPHGKPRNAPAVKEGHQVYWVSWD